MPTIDASIQEFFSTQDTPNKNINTQTVPITETVAPEPKPTGKPQPVDPNLLNFFKRKKSDTNKKHNQIENTYLDIVISLNKNLL